MAEQVVLLETGSGALFADLRLLLVADDPFLADLLAKELRARGALVAVADSAGHGLWLAREADPQVVLIDPFTLVDRGGPLARALRGDLRLRWASVLRCRWERLFRHGALAGTDGQFGVGSPDVGALVHMTAPLADADRKLRARARTKRRFEAELDDLGPGRALRALAQAGRTLHVAIATNGGVTAGIDLAEGLVVGATFSAPDDGAALAGTAALAAILALHQGSMTIERRTHPAALNIMAPIDEALHAAGETAAKIQPTIRNRKKKSGVALREQRLDEVLTPAMPEPAEPVTVESPVAAAIAGGPSILQTSGGPCGSPGDGADGSTPGGIDDADVHRSPTRIRALPDLAGEGPTRPNQALIEQVPTVAIEDPTYQPTSMSAEEADRVLRNATRRASPLTEEEAAAAIREAIAQANHRSGPGAVHGVAPPPPGHGQPGPAAIIAESLGNLAATSDETPLESAGLSASAEEAVTPARETPVVGNLEPLSDSMDVTGEYEPITRVAPPPTRPGTQETHAQGDRRGFARAEWELLSPGPRTGGHTGNPDVRASDTERPPAAPGSERGGALDGPSSSDDVIVGGAASIPPPPPELAAEPGAGFTPSVPGSLPLLGTLDGGPDSDPDSESITLVKDLDEHEAALIPRAGSQGDAVTVVAQRTELGLADEDEPGPNDDEELGLADEGDSSGDGPEDRGLTTVDRAASLRAGAAQPAGSGSADRRGEIEEHPADRQAAQQTRRISVEHGGPLGPSHLPGEDDTRELATVADETWGDLTPALLNGEDVAGQRGDFDDALASDGLSGQHTAVTNVGALLADRDGPPQPSAADRGADERQARRETDSTQRLSPDEAPTAERRTERPTATEPITRFSDVDSEPPPGPRETHERLPALADLMVSRGARAARDGDAPAPGTEAGQEEEAGGGSQLRRGSPRTAPRDGQQGRRSPRAAANPSRPAAQRPSPAKGLVVGRMIATRASRPPDGVEDRDQDGLREAGARRAERRGAARADRRDRGADGDGDQRRTSRPPALASRPPLARGATAVPLPRGRTAPGTIASSVPPPPSRRSSRPPAGAFGSAPPGNGASRSSRPPAPPRSRASTTGYGPGPAGVEAIAARQRPADGAGPSGRRHIRTLHGAGPSPLAESPRSVRPADLGRANGALSSPGYSTAATPSSSPASTSHQAPRSVTLFDSPATSAAPRVARHDGAGLDGAGLDGAGLDGARKSATPVEVHWQAAARPQAVALGVPPVPGDSAAGALSSPSRFRRTPPLGSTNPAAAIRSVTPAGAMLAPSVPARARKSSATFGAGKMILLGLAAILLFGSLGAGTVVVMKRLRGDAGLATLREGTAEPQPGQQDTGLADQDREGSGTVAQSPAASDPGQNGDLTPTAVQPAAAAVQPAETAVQPAETAVQPAETAVQPAETAVQPAEADPDQAATADPIPNDPPSADIAAPAAAGGGRDREASDVLVARASPLIRTNPADAQRLLEEAVLRDERNPHAAAGLAETHLASGNLREALHWAEQAISLRRRRAEYRLLLGDVLRADGKIDEARRAYRQALRYDPDDRDARARLAEL